LDPVLIAFGCFALVVLLIGLRVPLSVALGSVGLIGFAMLRSPTAALSLLRDVPVAFVAKWELSAIPIFLFVGGILEQARSIELLFAAARRILRKVPANLAVAVNFVSVLFAAACGSSVAASATLTRIAVPPMLAAGYDPGLATGVVASAGTIAALIPPSIVIVIYGIYAEVSILDLMVAGIVPGLLTAVAYTAMIMLRVWIRPDLAPKQTFEAVSSTPLTWAQALPAMAVTLGLFGSMMTGLATPTEAGAIGAAAALMIGLGARRLSFPGILAAASDAARTTSQLVFVGLGAMIFSRFMALGGIGPWLAQTLIGSEIGAAPFLLIVVAIFLFLGAFFDSLGALLISIPVFLPVVTQLHIDPVLFGIFVVKLIEVGMLTPPIGFNVFVVSSIMTGKVPMSQIFRGAAWFVACDLVVLFLMATHIVLARS
jgi:tripartite ATP-independent transporter DctM subunit